MTGFNKDSLNNLINRILIKENDPAQKEDHLGDTKIFNLIIFNSIDVNGLDDIISKAKNVNSLIGMLWLNPLSYPALFRAYHL